MLDLNFSEEFSRRSEILLSTEESRQAVLDEFETLDPREANIIYRSFSHDTGSLEYEHAKIRINALVASGVVSSDLASLTSINDKKDISEEKEEQEESLSYEYSRQNFKEALENQALYNGGVNPYDPQGYLLRMIVRGDSKKDIKNYLEKNLFYQSQMELASEGNSENDLAVDIALFKFKQINDALEELEDPKVAPDFVTAAKVATAPYDEDMTIFRQIDKGMSSEEILLFLSSYDAWNEDAEDFITRGDVDMPTDYQRNKWARFQTILNAIKDLDSLKLSK